MSKYSVGEKVNVWCECGCVDIKGTLIAEVIETPNFVRFAAMLAGLPTSDHLYIVEAGLETPYPEQMIHPFDDGDSKDKSKDIDQPLPKFDEMMDKLKRSEKLVEEV